MTTDGMSLISAWITRNHTNSLVLQIHSRLKKTSHNPQYVDGPLPSGRRGMELRKTNSNRHKKPHKGQFVFSLA
jgi:hypothetical protein